VIEDDLGRCFRVANFPDADGGYEQHGLSWFPDDPNPEGSFSLTAKEAEDLRARFQIVHERETRPRTAITDERLKRVAETYRNALALGKHPTRAVMDHGPEAPIARATASRWIKQARAKGFLGAAVERRAGEF
jgi:hypothetical protein